MDFIKLPENTIIEETIKALKINGIEAVLVANGEEAKNKISELIPAGSEVMNMTSVTLSTLGIDEMINESGTFDSVKNNLSKMDRATQGGEMKKLGAAPTYVIGSVHAVTEDGKVLIGSYSGSQLPAYSYGSEHVIWVVGTQKIVKDLDTAFKRLYEHTLPLESERAKKAYGMPASFVSKALIINREITPGRITIIFVPEVLGF